VRSDGIAIGGVGGSGTRLVAGALAAAGYFIGYDLNEASDNLTFSLLFVRREILDASDDEFAGSSRSSRRRRTRASGSPSTKSR